MKNLRFTISEDMEETRIDKCVLLFVEGLSRSYLQNIIKNGGVLVNDRTVKPSYCVKTDDVIDIMIPEATEPSIEPENIPLDILFEDEDILIVNKPKNMVVHPAPGHYSGTLVNAVLHHCRNSLSGINGILRPGVVHRIDRDTTGSIIICKNDFSHNSIAAQLKEHSINRVYDAICHGSIKTDGTVDAPIGRSSSDRKKMAVKADGKTAVTHYQVIKNYEKFTYLKCRLETGRTHQIRVHLSSLNHPLLGDAVYNTGFKSPYNLEGQCLHAGLIGFIHPRTGKYVEVEAPLPDYFKHLLDIML